MAPEILHLSNIVRRPLVDSSDERIGRIEDCVVRLGGRPHPQVSGFVARIGNRELFVPIARVAAVEANRVRLVGHTVNLTRFERRPGELLLVRDLASRHLINLVGARLIRANEIELALVDGEWEVIGVDPSRRGVIRHLLPRRLSRHIGPGEMIDWSSIEPFVGHVPSARLRIPYRKLAKLHPAQIADLVEAASHEEGEEIIKVVGADRELEADVFEELDPEHQREFLESRSDEEAARILARMEPDDAADLITDLDQDRRRPILEALPAPLQAKIRSLLSYNPETAGGLISPNFLSVSEETTVGDVIEAVRRSEIGPGVLATVYASNEEGQLVGVASVVQLLKASPQRTFGAIVVREPVSVPTDADLHSIARRMSDFNLSMVPVVDANDVMVGVITVDDVMELLLPEGWRRDFGMTTAEE